MLHTIKLFHRRRNAAKAFEPLTKHLDILDALGEDGMSTDESEIEPLAVGSRTSYKVTKPEWRHPDLHHWLSIFDGVHEVIRARNYDRDKRGARAHVRDLSRKVHRKTCAPRHLPINAYDPNWIDSREPLYVNHMLCPRMDQQYDFTHSPNVYT
jgi:hypothetical protein